MTGIRDALQRLEKLTQEEVQMVAHGVARAAARVSDEVEKVGDQVISGACARFRLVTCTVLNGNGVVVFGIYICA